MRTALFIALSTLLVLVVNTASQAQSHPTANSASDAEAQSQPTVADLYIFNDSGRTLIPSNQVVTDNGVKLVSLPRQAYARVQLQPGPHLLKPDPPLWKQQVDLDVAAGNRYFVVVAYKPERSWAAPLAGAPLILREITEEQAAPLMKQMKPQ